MPMFGSMSGGRASMSGASDQTSESSSKGARPNEGTDQGALCLIPIMTLC